MPNYVVPDLPKATEADRIVAGYPTSRQLQLGGEIHVLS